MAVTLTTAVTVPAFTRVVANPFSSVSVDDWESVIPPTVVDSSKVTVSPVVIGWPLLSLSLKVTSDTLGLLLFEFPARAMESGSTLTNSSPPITGGATVMVALAVAPFCSLAVIVSWPAQPASYVVANVPEADVTWGSKEALEHKDESVTVVGSAL